MTSIRKATEQDRDAIRELYLQAFAGGEEAAVARVAIDLLAERTRPGTVCLVADIDRVIAGHVAFSPVAIESRDNWSGYILAPLGVIPRFQKRGIGSKLIERGLAQLSERGVDTVFVYGDPAYYGRHGFRAETAAGCLPPYDLQYPFGWQAIALREETRARLAAKISCVASLSDPALW